MIARQDAIEEDGMRKLSLLAMVVALQLVAGPAWAHHAMGGQIPTGFPMGLMSGLAHPVINLDHLAFIVAIGILTAVTQSSILLPVWFVAGTVGGCALLINGLQLPYVQWLVPASVLVLGGFMVIGRQRRSRLAPPLFLLAGLLHGISYAQSILGSEPTSMQGYLLGFAVIQTIIAWSAMCAAYLLWGGDKLETNGRVAGGVVAGIGLSILFQSGMSLLFVPA
jgi:urease accessory protein